MSFRKKNIGCTTYKHIIIVNRTESNVCMHNYNVNIVDFMCNTQNIITYFSKISVLQHLLHIFPFV
jgi:hypothetical protein